MLFSEPPSRSRVSQGGAHRPAESRSKREREACQNGPGPHGRLPRCGQYHHCLGSVGRQHAHVARTATKPDLLHVHRVEMLWDRPWWRKVRPGTLSVDMRCKRVARSPWRPTLACFGSMCQDFRHPRTRIGRSGDPGLAPAEDPGNRTSTIAEESSVCRNWVAGSPWRYFFFLLPNDLRRLSSTACAVQPRLSCLLMCSQICSIAAVVTCK